MEVVIEQLARAGAKVIADLGCGEGKLLGRLARDKRFARLVGLDVSAQALQRAAGEDPRL
jgi:predicted TPR repeat methyltransferase